MKQEPHVQETTKFRISVTSFHFSLTFASPALSPNYAGFITKTLRMPITKLRKKTGEHFPDDRERNTERSGFVSRSNIRLACEAVGILSEL